MEQVEQQRRLKRFLLGVGAGIGPPAVVVFLAREAVQRHWIVFVILTVGWQLLLGVLGVAARVYTNLQNRWVERLTETLDNIFRRRTSRYGRRYLEYVASLHHDLDLRGLTTVGEFALPISTVFVDLSLDTSPIHELESDPLQLQTRRAPVVKAKFEAARARRSIWDFLRQPENEIPARLAIIGPPGSGKTTLLRHMSATLATGGRDLPRDHAARRLVPFLIFLREHVEAIVGAPRPGLTDILRKEMKNVEGQEPPGWLESELSGGRCLVLLDGLDEVTTSEDRKRIVAWVDAQIAKYSRNTFVVTSRPYGYRSQPLMSATTLQVRPFTEAQVGSFLRNWYLAIHSRVAGRQDIGIRKRAEQDSANLLQRLRENSSLYDLSVNPLLLTMIAHVHFYRGALPGSRVELYREVCQVFLGKRQEAKHLTSTLTTDQKETVLRTLAFSMMRDRIRDVTPEKANSIIGPILRRVKASDLTVRDFLEYVETTSGLMVEREMNLFSFTHLTLQEYLAAAYVKEQREIEALTSRVDDEWWREVQLLYAAQSDATPLISACLSNSEPSVYALALAVDCVEIAREVDPAVRQALDNALDAEAALQDTERGLRIRTVQLNRRLRAVVRLGEDTQICRNLVSRNDLQLLVDTQNPQFTHLASNNARQQLLAQYGSQDVAVGVGYEDALTFVSWAQETYSAAQQSPVGASWTYRLPSLEDNLFDNEFARTLVGDRGVWTVEGILLFVDQYQETPEEVEIILGRVVCDFLSYRLVAQEPSSGGGYHGQTRNLEIEDAEGDSISIDGLPILECLSQCEAFIKSNRDDPGGMLAEDNWIVAVADVRSTDEYAGSVRSLIPALRSYATTGLYVPTQYLLELLHQSVLVLTTFRDEPTTSRELMAIAGQAKVAASKARTAILEHLGRGARASAYLHVTCVLILSALLRLDRLRQVLALAPMPSLSPSAREVPKPDIKALQLNDAILIAYRNLVAALPPLLIRYARSREILTAREVALLVRDRGLGNHPAADPNGRSTLVDL
jgi:NACHT domain